MRGAMKVIPWPEPQLIEGENSIKKLPKYIRKKSIESVLIVTDQGIVKAGIMENLLEQLKREAITYYVYDKTVPNPTINNIEEAVNLYHIYNCEGIIAFGGGSCIDCAKLTGARIVKPNKKVEQLRGLFKVMKQTPPLFAVPTTAGTGAEATLAAVFSNNKTNEKHPVMDTSIIPDVAVLDPLLTIELPPNITAETGMDALTHAVEAYIGRSNTKETKEWSIEAIKLIFNHLYDAYEDGENIKARKQMLKAAHLAGKAFTRAYVGYVHAIAHQLGGFYNVPHGLANAVILPHVLQYYGDSIHKKLAELADLIEITEETDTYFQKAQKFIIAIEQLNEQMGIPPYIDKIENRDVPKMIERALEEANPLYPVPKTLAADDLSQLFYLIKK